MSEKYSLEKAQEEAQKLQQKVESGEASNYAEAEKQIEAELTPEKIEIILQKVCDIERPGIGYRFTRSIGADLDRGFIPYTGSELSGKELLEHIRENKSYIPEVNFNITGRSIDSKTIAESHYAVGRLSDSYKEAILFETGHLEELEKREYDKENNPKEYWKRTSGKGEPFTEDGFGLVGRVSPRFFTGIAVNRDRFRDDAAIEGFAKSIGEYMFGRYKIDRVLPIYDLEGNLLWPKKMSHEEIYFRDLDKLLESPDLEPMLKNIGEYKTKFQQVIESAQTPQEAIKGLAELTISIAENVNTNELEKFIEYPLLFKALFATREVRKDNISDIKPPETWGKDVRKSILGRDDNMLRVLLRGLMLAYVSKDLNPELRKKFIELSINEKVHDAASLRSGFETYVDDLFFLKGQDLRKLLNNAGDFREAAWRGRQNNPHSVGGVRKDVANGFGKFYESYGNSGVPSFLNSLIKEDMLNSNNPKVEGIVVEIMRREPQRVEEAKEFLMNFYLRKALPKEMAEKQVEYRVEEAKKKS